MFSQKGNLTVHMALHTSERPSWKCSHCGKTFGFKSNLTKHLKTVHMVKEEEIQDTSSASKNKRKRGPVQKIAKASQHE